MGRSAGEEITCVWEITDIDERGRARTSIQITNAEDVIVLEAETAGVLPGEMNDHGCGRWLPKAPPSNGARR